MEGDPQAVATANAAAKARAVAAQLGPGAFVLGADTVVAVDGEIFGKPGDAEHAAAMLRRLQGRSHEVWSAIAVAAGGGLQSAAARTTVHFAPADEATIAWYVGTGEWRERAGAYAIQGKGALLVDRIDGDYFNVVGLPITALRERLPEIVQLVTP
jgi:septum formation protein